MILGSHKLIIYGLHSLGTIILLLCIIAIGTVKKE